MANHLAQVLRLSLLPLVLILSACSQEQGSAPAGPGSAASPAAGEETSASKPIVVAVAAPMTGDSSEFGAQIKMAVDIAAEELNARGGIKGRPVQVLFEDDAGNPAEAQSVATKIASNPDVLAVIGHFLSSCSLAARSAYAEAGIVMLTPASTNPAVTKNTDYVFRNIFTDDFQGQSLARYAATILNVRKVAILFDNDDYGQGLKESFKQKGQSLGMTVLNETAYSKDTNDFRSQLTTIRGYQPEIILVAGLYKHAAVIAKQARELGIQTPLLGGDGLFSQQFLDLAGPAAEGTYVSCPFLFDLGGERARTFAEKYRARYHSEPGAWAALGFDAFQLIVEAIEKNGPSRDAIHRYLKGVNSPATAFEGITGKTFFDREGNCRRPIHMAVVRGGRFVAAEKQLDIEEETTAVTTLSQDARTSR
jgi:branched-chain amino acid transport system substrate-binding protein